MLKTAQLLCGGFQRWGKGERMRAYSPLAFASLVALCVLGFALVGIASALPQYAALDHALNAGGEALLVADMVLVLIADWQGFLTLNGRLNWRSMSDGKRMLYGVLYLIFGPLLLIVYLGQIARNATPTAPAAPQDTHL
jgi:hypothetical protein